MSYRVAIYFAPAATSPLWLKAAQWLGRDALTGAEYGDDIGGAQIGVGPRAWPFRRDVDPDLVHDLDRHGVDRLPWLGTAREHTDPIAGQPSHPPGGHLRPTGVVHT